jgi:ribonuclease H / adenosylcobalamin/alpha-ribazole phosphatase
MVTRRSWLRKTEWDSVVGTFPLSWRTHHEAEYEAAILALIHAWRLGAISALVRTDSRLVVDQVNGDASVDAQQLVKPNQRLRRQIEQYGKTRVAFRWVSRQQNKAADKLAEFAREKGAITDW